MRTIKIENGPLELSLVPPTKGGSRLLSTLSVNPKLKDGFDVDFDRSLTSTELGRLVEYLSAAPRSELDAVFGPVIAAQRDLANAKRPYELEQRELVGSVSAFTILVGSLVLPPLMRDLLPLGDLLGFLLALGTFPLSLLACATQGVEYSQATDWKSTLKGAAMGVFGLVTAKRVLDSFSSRPAPQEAEQRLTELTAQLGHQLTEVAREVKRVS